MFLCELCVQPETRQGGHQLYSWGKDGAKLQREKSVNNCLDGICFSKQGSSSVFEVLGC